MIPLLFSSSPNMLNRTRGTGDPSNTQVKVTSSLPPIDEYTVLFVDLSLINTGRSAIITMQKGSLYAIRAVKRGIHVKGSGALLRGTNLGVAQVLFDPKKGHSELCSQIRGVVTLI